MIVKEVAFGNLKEAYVEDRFIDYVNIIFSDDNNRGKTLVIQGLMYSLGYDSIFPSTFNYKDQYFYSKISTNNGIFEFLRKKNSLIARSQDSIQVFNSVSDFKYYFDRNVTSLPRIIKDNRSRIVDLSLFYEVFFIGQDNRSPSNLISRGQFNKADFKEMVYSISGVVGGSGDTQSSEDIKKNITSLKAELKSLKKKLSIKNKNPEIAEIASKAYESESFQKKMKAIDSLNKEISNLKRSKKREANRKSKLDNLVKELNSLNRNLSEGSVRCADCGSDKVIYSNNDFSFEISNIDVRNNIIESIYENISQKEELIFELSSDINRNQDILYGELRTTPPRFQEIVLYQEDIIDDQDVDDELFRVMSEIRRLNSELNVASLSTESDKQAKKSLFDKLIKEMSRVYREIDSSGNLVFDDIFSKRDSTFSGSEEQEFYFSKLVALNNVLGHEYPLIVDSFRDGELSTYKEIEMLNFYKRINKQVILTSTLKREEYEARKYTSEDNVKVIDYSSFQNCKILQKKYLPKFNKILESFDGLIFK